MSNLSNAEIAALIWNKTSDVPFSELSDEKRTELEVAVATGNIEGDIVVVEVLPEVATDPWAGKKLVDKIKKAVPAKGKK